MMRAAIAFDLDGTLIEVSHRDYKIYADLIAEIKGLPISYTPYWTMRRAKTDIHSILSQSGIDSERGVEYFLTERKKRMERADYLALDTLFPSVDDTLRCLDQEHDVYILTIRHNKENTIQQLSTLGIDRYRSYIVDSDKKSAMSKIPNLQFMVGDTENDILPANELGIKSIAVTTGIRNESLLEAMRPTHIVESLEDIPKILR